MSTPKATTVRMKMNEDEVYIYINGLRQDMQWRYNTDECEYGDDFAYHNTDVWKNICSYSPEEVIKDTKNCDDCYENITIFGDVLTDLNELIEKMEIDRKRCKRVKKMLAKFNDDYDCMEDTEVKMDMMYGACKEYQKRLLKARKKAAKKYVKLCKQGWFDDGIVI